MSMQINKARDMWTLEDGTQVPAHPDVFLKCPECENLVSSMYHSNWYNGGGGNRVPCCKECEPTYIGPRQRARMEREANAQAVTV
jgi:hypothetical protein